MGNLDRWSTPKQIKIERAGDPRPLRRGLLKKGERRKGKKARIDELLSLKRTLLRYADWIVSDRKQRKEHPDWFHQSTTFDWHYSETFDDYQKKQDILLAAALKDGVITSVEEYLVKKP